MTIKHAFHVVFWSSCLGLSPNTTTILNEGMVYVLYKHVS